jgi:putative membrane protein
MLISAAAALVIAGSAALAQQTAPAAGGAAAAQRKAPAETVAFARKLAGANAFEIKSSELAQDRAQSDEVKSFAKQMIADHTKIGEDFKSVLQAAKIQLPPERPDAKQKATLLKLQKAKGPAFDKAYLSAQLAGHKQAVALVGKYAKTGRTPQFKELAQKTLPTLQQHLSELTDLRNRAVAAGKTPSGTGSRAIGPPAEPQTRHKKR